MGSTWGNDDSRRPRASSAAFNGVDVNVPHRLLCLRDARSTARAGLAVVKDEWALILCDEKGKVLWSAP